MLFFICNSSAEVLKAGISIESVPKQLFGVWKVEGKLDKTTSYDVFKPQGLDVWNLSRNGEYLKLDNPNSGASSTVTLDAVEGNLVIFTKKSNYSDYKVLTDTVSIRVNENTFDGINELKLESFSAVDNHLMKTETAIYIIKGIKISGDTIFP